MIGKNDLISRKAAIKAIRKDMYADKDYMSAMICEGIEDVLNGLPSAEPERKKPDHGYMWICPECGLEVHSDFARCVRCGWDRPNAERKKGRWIEDAESFYKAVNEKGGGVDENTPYFTDDIACSECLAKFSVIDNEAERFDFCPNCGADMREPT